MPLFKSVSKNALFKLAFAIKEASFVKGQTVFKEGETAKNIFIIREGEIKLKKIIVSNENTNSIRKIVKRRVYTARKYGQGGVIGDDDAINNKTYTYSCICSSDVLILYTITTREFLRRVNSNESIEYMKQRHTKKIEELND